MPPPHESKTPPASPSPPAEISEKTQAHLQPERRSFLGWVINGIGLIFAAVLGFPVVAYILDPRNRAAAAGAFRPMARVEDLRVNEPREYVIREQRRDAWTLHPNEIIGRVFLIKRPNGGIEAFTTICPHLGCSINFTGSTSGVSFLCPCHGGRFDLAGKRIQPDNPAPRDMDSLEVQVQDGLILVKYLNFVPGDKKIERK